MCKLTRGERFKDARTVHNKNGSQSMDEVYNTTGVSASMIKDLEDDDKNRSVGYDKIAALAKHYGVSADYLLGLSPNPTTDKDVDAICNYTGLSDTAIENLNTFSANGDFGHHFLYLLNHFLLDPRFTHELTHRIIKYCNAYLEYQQGVIEHANHHTLISELTNDDLAIEIDLLQKGILTKSITNSELFKLSDLKDLSHFQVQRAFDNVLDCLTFHYCKKNGCDLDGTYRKK